MTPSLTGLPAEKLDSIISASLEEFIAKGYNGASTNAIVSKAGISKGLLFHYFGNKKSLYLFLVEHSMGLAQLDFAQSLPHLSTDLVERAMEWSVQKGRLYRQNPLPYRFLVSAFVNAPAELSLELGQYSKRMKEENLRLFMNGVDLSDLREDIDKEQAIQVLFVLREWLQRRYLDSFEALPEDSMDEALSEAKRVYDIFMYGAYRQKDLH